jgi:chitinase
MISARLSLCFCAFFLSQSLFAADEVAVGRDDHATAATFRIAGYLPDYRFDGIDLNATVEQLDDLYLFSLSPQSQLGSNMFAVCCLHENQYEKARQAVAHAATKGKEVKLWVTVGGGGRSHSFVKAPDIMIGALKELTAEQNLQGVDFDCENFLSHQDYVDYEALIMNAARVLHKEGVQISVALHVGQKLPEEVYTVVDRINLMSYDMSGSSYHADFRQAREAVTSLVESGCPIEKIFLGLPAYGRHKHQVSEAKTYAELADRAMAHGVSVEGLHKKYEIEGYLIDSPAAVSAKVRYAKNEGLGGVFFWELGQDKQLASAPAGILLSAAAARVAESPHRNDSQTTSTERTAEIYEVPKTKEEL